MSKVRKEARYSISFKSFKNGLHYFDFRIDESFLSFAPDSRIQNANLDVAVEMQKADSFLKLDIKMKGFLTVPCDRCLEPVDYPVDFDTELNVRFSQESSDLSEADRSIYLAETETELILDKHFFDYINLSIPIQVVHPADEDGKSTCKPEMLELLRKNTPEENTDRIDPRWEKLKSLMN